MLNWMFKYLKHDFSRNIVKKIVQNFGIHGCIVLYPIRVVTIRAIADNYCITTFFRAKYVNVKWAEFDDDDSTL